MKLEVEWNRPLALKSGARDGLIYAVELDRIERSPGVYIFVRRWGKSFEALYVGQSGNLRSRIKSHLNSLRLMRHIETAKTGRRFVLLGQPIVHGPSRRRSAEAGESATAWLGSRAGRKSRGARSSGSTPPTSSG